MTGDGHNVVAAQSILREVLVKHTCTLATTALAGCLMVTAAAQARVLIQNKGSDTLVNVAQAWAEAYREIDPEEIGRAHV